MKASVFARPGYVVGVLLTLNLLNSFDRIIIAAVNELLRKEWTLSDAQIGALFGAFMVVYAIAGVPLGWLADRARRVPILAAGVFLWSLFTALGGFATSYAQLLFMRAWVGIGEATFMPAAASIVGDVFPTTKRGKVMSIVMLGIPLGIILGFGVGGLIAQHFGWRTAFFIAIAPGLLCAVAAALMKEPARGGAEIAAIGTRRREASALRGLVKIPTFWVLVLTATIHYFASFSLASFSTPLLMRYYGLTVAEVGVAMGLIAGVAPVIGMIAGGIAADALVKRRSDGAMIVAATTLLLSVPAYFFAFRLTPNQSGVYLALIALSQLLMMPTTPLQQSMLQDVVEPSSRGLAIALQAFGGSVIGGTLGPVVTGVVSDRLAAASARAAGVSELTPAAIEPFRPAALQSALLMIIPGSLLVLGLALVIARRWMRQDVAKLQRWMTEPAE